MCVHLFSSNLTRVEESKVETFESVNAIVKDNLKHIHLCMFISLLIAQLQVGELEWCLHYQQDLGLIPEVNVVCIRKCAFFKCFIELRLKPKLFKVLFLCCLQSF